MAIASLVNPKKASARPGAPKKNKTKSPGKAKAHAAKNKTTVARSIGPATIAKFQKQGAAMERNRLKAAGAIENKRGKKKKSHKRHTKNPGGLSSLLPSFPNPTFRGIWGGLKTGAFGLAGGAGATIIAALGLALLDKFAPAWANHRYAQMLATLVAAVLIIPMIASIKFLRLSEASKESATWGGIIFGLGQGFNELTGKNIFSNDVGNEIVTGARNLFPSTGDAKADAAGLAVLKAGGTKEQAAAAAAGTLSGFRGGNGGGRPDYTRGGQPMGSVSRF